VEHVQGLLSNVASIVCHGRVHHGLAHLVARPPHWLGNILLELDHVLLALFFVDVLLRSLSSVSTAESFVVTNVRLVSMLERSVVGSLHGFLLLFREFAAVGISKHISIERAVLTGHLAEGLVAVEDLGVQASILITIKVFFTLVGVLRVAVATEILELGERLSGLAVVKSGDVGVLGLGVLLHVCEFTPADGAVTVHREERLRLGGGRAELGVELSWVDVRIAQGVEGLLGESFLGVFAGVHCHATNLADFMTLLAESLVIG